jgi:hypothetical protein
MIPNTASTVRPARARGPEQSPSTARHAGIRQQALADFVQQHDLTCFRCEAEKAEWAKTGISKRGPRAICVPCASAPE